MTTARIDALKKRFFDTPLSITAERLLLATEAHKKYAGDPAPVFRAKIFAYVLDNMGITIADDELIVGMSCSTYKGANLFPEYTSAEWILSELDDFGTRDMDPYVIADEDKQAIKDCLEDYWIGKSLQDALYDAIPTYIMEAIRTDMISIGTRNCTTGATVPDYGKLMEMGFNGLIRECQLKLEESVSLPRSKEVQEKIEFWQGCIITAEGLIRFALRHAEAAEALAAKESDPKRKVELLKIAEVCRNIPANKPRNFHEALQFCWFVHIGFHIETRTTECQFGRFDQSFGPYLEQDYANGIISHDDALELLEAFYIKTGEPVEVRDRWSSEAFAGYPMWAIVMIGGQTVDGGDVTNELSYLALEAATELKMAEPVLALRVHKGTPKKLIRQAVSMVQAGLANPGFFNDNIAIPIVLSKGATVEEALDWVIVGCTQPHPGGGCSEGTPDAGYVSATKALELVLHDGIDPQTGELSGLRTGDASKFTTKEEIIDACVEQMLHQYAMIRDGFRIVQMYHMTRLPMMLASACIRGCIETGMSLQDGGSKHKSAGLFITGPANLVDSIVAIDEIVFKDKVLTMEELIEALDNNFSGEERLRQLLLTKPPKFGNDNPYVDGLARSIMKRIATTVQEWKDARGGSFDFTMQSQSVNVPQGKAVGATPDGRLAGQPVSDNSSPMMGRDIQGPTATVKSVAAWDQLYFHDGALFNLRFDPRGVQGEKGLDIIEGVIKTYFEDGGQHIQINVVDDATLRKAQEKPEDYRSLVVRVAGYMAYFTELDHDVQNSIIARTAHLAS